MKVLLTHPGTQHSFRVATALKKHGLLYKYVTTVYDKKDSFTMKIVKLFLNKNNLSRANRRKCAALEDNDVIQFCEWFALFGLLLVRIDHSRKIYNWWEKTYSAIYQKKLAKYIIRHKDEIDMVISYDLHSSILFPILKEKTPRIKLVMDNAHPARNYLYEVYNGIDSGKFRETYAQEGGGFLVDKQVADKYGEEIRMADYHIVASSFSIKALKFNHIDDSKILFVPYGVSKKDDVNNTLKESHEGLNILFVGEVNQRKGIYQILEAAKQLKDKNIKFDIVGRGGDVCGHLYKPYTNCANFHGHVSFEKLQELYKHADVFLFPTLGEGFGLVLLEALSKGIPVIASTNCAGPDLIEDGKNGFIINPGHVNEIVEKLNFLLNNPDELEIMSNYAARSISNYTWENYENKLCQCLINIYSQDK
ncbi:MAG: glycosyltransferase family 4 protein [Prevotella sp.]|nr:glycosyltransferase family 4 protein [Prevotella sp.]